jgi:hypothetical protein
VRDELVLGHAERAGHPAEEGDVGADVEVDEAADGGARGVVVLALAGEVELGEVDAVVDGLDAEDGEEDEEDEGAEDVDEGGDAQVLERRHSAPAALSAACCCCCCCLGGEKRGGREGRELLGDGSVGGLARARELKEGMVIRAQEPRVRGDGVGAEARRG